MHKFKNWLLTLFGSDTTSDPGAPGRYRPNDAGAINDGVDYSQPLLLPRWLHERLSSGGKLQRYVRRHMRENLRDSFDFQFDAPYRDLTDLPVTAITEDPLREWNRATRERVLTNCHAAYQRNPIAKRAVEYTASFVVGEGFRLTSRNREVERVLRDFIANPDNDVRGYERQAVIDLLVDGELLLRFFEGEDDAVGQVVMVPQRPWELVAIRAEPGFFRRPELFHFQRQVSAGDDPQVAAQTVTEAVAAADMLHVAINRHSYELRGRPELYAVLPWLRAYRDWLENRARQNHWRNALLWHVSVKSGSAATVAAVAERYRKPPTPGSVAVTSDKEEWRALTNPVGAGDAAEDGRQIKLMSAVGLGLPEYMLSDGSNTNLASATRQQLPALTTFADFQRIMLAEVWQPVFERVLRRAVAAGDLPYEVAEQTPDGSVLTDADGLPQMIPVLEAFAVTYEPIQQDDMLDIAHALDIAVNNKWASNETASRELGFDYAQERRKIERESV